VARSHEPLPTGLYETPISRALAEALEKLGADRTEVAALRPEDAPQVLARLLYDRLVHSLGAVPAESRLEHQVALVNQVIELLRQAAPRGGAEVADQVASPARLLLAVHPPPDGSLGTRPVPERPHVPLAASELLVNSHQDLSVGPEIRRELASADRVELLCSFLKWNGYRVIEEALKAFLERRPGALRVLTTTYIGATERRALDALAALGAQLKISYDTGRTRLHAKAWLFHRDSGFSTAYIGSSNLSASAMLDGLEWNVRLSRVDNGPILAKFEAAFEQYWADPEFEAYDPARDGERFEKAVRRERGDEGDAPLLAAIEVTPRPHQQEILDDLAAERARGHFRNLVVAATGTGKTVVAALDYRRLAKAWRAAPRIRAPGPSGAPPSLLFVAHRDEILRQSQQTFRLALGDGSFGERLVSGEVPAAGRHVFASIQSFHADRLRELRPDAYEILIVDEFHHAAAESYDRLLEHLRPRILLGLTATPERADGRSILHHFDHRIASELRLWKALDQGLLSPFQYFGLEGPDVSHVPWKRGRYETAGLSNVYTASDAFALRVVQELRHEVADVRRMRALGFCVDVRHAEFMAERFRRAGIEALAVSGETPWEERRAALLRLQHGDLRVLFSVDLFNEGVDLPDVDTLLFLRPTESATLFLQQLGRGLRRREDKPCCTVLDFIGSASRKFRFDLRFRAIVGGTRRHVERQIQQGFPSLPSGCAIVLDRASQQAVLENVRRQLGTGQIGLIEDLRALGPDAELPRFLRETGFELEDVYERPGCCFTDLRRRAGFAVPPVPAEGRRLERALARMLHVDDEERLGAFRTFLSAPAPPRGDPASTTQRVLFVLLGYLREPLSRMGHAWSELWAHDALRRETLQLLDLIEDRSRRLTAPLPGRLATLPFRTHASYTLDEVMAGLGERTAKGGVMRIQTGVYYSEPHACDLFFVTLEKSERDYTPTTLYRDYPLSPGVFHWESQSNCHEATPTGRRYLELRRGGAQQALLFVRQRRRDDRGMTAPYLLLGPVYYRTHRGGRPMQVEWELERAMPAREFQEMKVAAG
jgi:superfamily II DNA or RNA helicase/HKD family nuclease